MLVNLALQAPPSFQSYARIAEFVDAQPERREAGRRRYAWYREHGVTATTHNVAGDAS